MITLPKAQLRWWSERPLMFSGSVNAVRAMLQIWSHKMLSVNIQVKITSLLSWRFWFLTAAPWGLLQLTGHQPQPPLTRSPHSSPALDVWQMHLLDWNFLPTQWCHLSQVPTRVTPPLKISKRAQGTGRDIQLLQGVQRRAVRMAPVLSPLQCPSLLHPARSPARHQGSPTALRSYNHSRQSFVSTSNRWLNIKELGLEASFTTRTDKFQQVQNFNWSLTLLAFIALSFINPDLIKYVSSVIPQYIIKYVGR